MGWGTIFQVAATVTSVVAALTLVATTFFFTLRKRQDQSLRDVIGVGSALDAESIRRVLGEFRDDNSRLKALKALLDGDGIKARGLLEKINGDIDVQRALRLQARTNEHRSKIMLIALAMLSAALLVAAIYARAEPGPSPLVNCPPHTQPFTSAELGIAFCFPRQGWELDQGPVAVDAADVYLRKSSDHDIGLHLHISLLPPRWAKRDLHVKYVERITDTWRQLDENLSVIPANIGGYSGYTFSLVVRTSTAGAGKPTKTTMVFLSEEKLLEAIRVWKGDSADKAALDRVVSTLTFRPLR